MINSFNVVAACPQPVFIYSADLKLLEANDAAVAFFGFSKDILLKLSVPELHPSIDRYDVIAEGQERKAGRNKATTFDTAFGLKSTQVCSYPASINGQEVTVEFILEVKPEVPTMQWKHLYARLIKTLEVMPAGFYLIDGDWKVIYWNKQAEEIFGLKRKKLLGKNLWQLFPEAIQSKYYSEYQRAMKTRTPVEFEEYYWPLQKWGRIHAHPLDEGLAVFFQDVTADLAAQETLKENIAQLREVGFIHSHLIRRPVANILALSELLATSNGDDSIEVNRLIRDSSMELDHIITKTNQMVNQQEDLTKLFANRSIEDVNVQAMFRELTSTFQQIYQDHLILFDAQADIRFLCNPLTIKELLMKAVDNAAQFSPKGSRIIIRAELQYCNLVISVRDQGIGMDEAMLRKFFLALNNQQEAKNFGNGLFRIAQIVQAHNGSAWVESTPGFGSTFFTRFPLSGFSELTKGKGRPEPGSAGSAVTVLRHPDLVEVQWNGFHDYYTIREGCAEMIEAVRRNGYMRVLNDNTGLLGNWHDAITWLRDNFHSPLEKHGVTKMAWVLSRSAFARFCVQQVVDHPDSSLLIRLFETRETALEWLLSDYTDPDPGTA
ncbi:MAG TPA: PAS domain-containing protein [Sphingobacteriaceae bacterium]